MTFETLLVEREGAVALVTVNRPSVLNALNRQTLDDLRQAVDGLAADEGVRAVVLTGAGAKAFVAGADINELATMTPEEGRVLASAGQAVFERIAQLGKPVIAAVNGFALGGGCELAMACTLRLAADTATFGQPEIKLGLMPGYGGTQRLPRLVGQTKALELLLTGASISAAEAERIGLVNRVVPAAALMDEARGLAAALAAQAPAAVRAILEAVHRGIDIPMAEACALEASLFGLLTATADMREGTRAFLEKRAARFTGR